MGTGSLEVLPDDYGLEDSSKGYTYTSHNLDTTLSQLWAFTGVAKLIGDAHRHYEQQAKSSVTTEEQL
jgi:hypothetical protein